VTPASDKPEVVTKAPTDKLQIVSPEDRRRWAQEALFGPHEDYLWPNRFRALNAEFERRLREDTTS
jgi:hypothetical protein